MKSWRLIIDPTLPGPENMSRDESILRSLDSGDGMPTLRLYGWDTPTVSIGYLQRAAPFTGAGLPVVRRITGGRAVLHGREVTYSVVGSVSDPLFSGGILDTYSVISRCIIAALDACGLDVSFSRSDTKGAQKEACFHTPSRFEVLSMGRKLVGSSQRRFRNAFLQHGSILFEVDKDLNEKVFGTGIISKMAWVGEFSPVTRERFIDIMVEKMAEGLGVSFVKGGLTSGEELEEKALLEKYSAVDWDKASAREGAAANDAF